MRLTRLRSNGLCLLKTPLGEMNSSSLDRSRRWNCNERPFEWQSQSEQCYRTA